MVVANSPLGPLYDLLIDLPVEIRVGSLEIAKPLLLWINDGLMAVFFFLVGLELKRELLQGELSTLRVALLPAAGALGGMVVPAAIYSWINWGDPVAIRGWAIPAATDIAFALGILSLLGKRVPVALKVFLVSVAIIDDLAAILTIAVFYTSDLSASALLVALSCLPFLFALNRRGVCEITPYVFIGLVLWLAVLKSGVHATLAGVALAFFIPIRNPQRPGHSPLRDLEHDLHTAVAFGILPIFAFANSGIRLAGAGLDYLLHTVPLGIAAGLFLGKQLGVFLSAWLAVRVGVADLPAGVRWRHVYGVALLCGVGFTMSLFIGSLAFDQTDASLLFDERLGIIVGSLLSGVIGYVVLSVTLDRRPEETD